MADEGFKRNTELADNRLNNSPFTYRLHDTTDAWGITACLKRLRPPDGKWKIYSQIHQCRNWLLFGTLIFTVFNQPKTFGDDMQLYWLPEFEIGNQYVDLNQYAKKLDNGSKTIDEFLEFITDWFLVHTEHEDRNFF